jgi:hypothetical protein
VVAPLVMKEGTTSSRGENTISYIESCSIE